MTSGRDKNNLFFLLFSREIYMCDTWNHRICVFSPDFRYVNRRWYLTRWQQTFNKVKPNFIAINKNNECDKMGYIQKIYDRESRNKPPNVEAKLNVPHGILLDDEGNWLTICYSDSELCWVERRAKANKDDNQELITYFHNKDFHGPSALAIKRDQTLVVGDRDDSTIRLFKLKNN